MHALHVGYVVAMSDIWEGGKSGSGVRIYVPLKKREKKKKNESFTSEVGPGSSPSVDPAVGLS